MPHRPGADKRRNRLASLAGQIISAQKSNLRRLEMLQSAVDQLQDDSEPGRVQANRRWGQIMLRMGTFVDAVVAPSIPRIAREDFGLGDVEISGLHVKVRNRRHPDSKREFDFVYVARDGWIVNATKIDPKLDDVTIFADSLAQLPDYFPQNSERPLYPLFSSLELRDDVVWKCTEHGIFAMVLGDHSMELLNDREVLEARLGMKARNFSSIGPRYASSARRTSRTSVPSL